MDFFGCVPEAHLKGGRYESKKRLLRGRWMAGTLPSMFAGHSVLCPYDCKGKGKGARLKGGRYKGKDAGHSAPFLCQGKRDGDLRYIWSAVDSQHRT